MLLLKILRGANHFVAQQRVRRPAERASGEILRKVGPEEGA
jgi:hypothetical protein